MEVCCSTSGGSSSSAAAAHPPPRRRRRRRRRSPPRPEGAGGGEAAAAAAGAVVGGEEMGKKRKYRGVRMRKWGRWVAEIREPNKRSRIWLGSYSSPVAAARAYDTAVYCLRGGAARLNFPGEVSPGDAACGGDSASIRQRAIEVGTRVDAALLGAAPPPLPPAPPPAGGSKKPDLNLQPSDEDGDEDGDNNTTEM